MPRVAAYIRGYAEQMSLVIGVERYAQWLQRDDFTTPSAGVVPGDLETTRRRIRPRSQRERLGWVPQRVRG